MAVSTECVVCSKTDTTLSSCARCKTTSYCSKGCQAKHWPAHKQDCKRPNYVLRVQLCPGDITDPPVWRTLSVPADTSFRKLHRALQIAFSWATTHSYEFHVHDPAYDPEASDTNEENELVNMIKKHSAMAKAQFEEGGWQGDPNEQRKYLVRVTDDREWSKDNFMMRPVDQMHEGNWAHPRTPKKGASQIRLFDVLDKPLYKGQQLTYLYDYGDRWEHEIKVIGSSAATTKIKCTDGEGHYVAEDAGASHGWNELLEAYKTASPTKEQKEKRSWFEKQASNRDPAGLSGDRARRWDKDGINMKLSVLA